MKNKKFVFMVFSMVLLFACGTYFAVQFVLGFRFLPTISPDGDGIGKIKYVDSQGNDVFASASAIVFHNPIEVGNVVVDGNIATIEVYEYTIVRAPAYGVVMSAENGVVEIDHGNGTSSRLSGLSNIAVSQNSVVFACQPIGATTSSVNFSVDVSELPLDMQWILSEFRSEDE